MTKSNKKHVTIIHCTLHCFVISLSLGKEKEKSRKLRGRRETKQSRDRESKEREREKQLGGWVPLSFNNKVN